MSLLGGLLRFVGNLVVIVLALFGLGILLLLW